MNCMEQATAIQAELVANRRAIHQLAEIGFDLPETTHFVMEKLREYGYEPQKIGQAGITCTVGHGGKTILLRADMDALPMGEESGLAFAACNGHCHSCGHDAHTAMLLGVAKLLKAHEKDLKGTVKLMFQPAEELLAGAKDMLEAGILENPQVNAALGMHIMVGRSYSATKTVTYCKKAVTSSGDAMLIHIHGKDAHGSTSYQGVDALHIACNVVLALEELIAREIPSTENSIVLVGKMVAGTSCNTVAGEATLEVSARTDSHEQRAFVLRRIGEIATAVAQTYRGTAEVVHLQGVPPFINDAATLEELTGYIGALLPEGKLQCIDRMGGGEDFALVAERVPTAFVVLGCGTETEGYPLSVHHPKMRIDEDALPVGVAVLTDCAMRWLERHAE